jgi:hypothetical protein
LKNEEGPSEPTKFFTRHSKESKQQYPQHTIKNNHPCDFVDSIFRGFWLIGDLVCHASTSLSEYPAQAASPFLGILKGSPLEAYSGFLSLYKTSPNMTARANPANAKKIPKIGLMVVPVIQPPTFCDAGKVALSYLLIRRTSDTPP